MTSAPAVPVLRPEHDARPPRCARCGSTILSSEPPLGRSRYGTITCVSCGELLAYVDAPSRLPARRTHHKHKPGIVPGRLLGLPSSQARWALPGCDARCNAQRHDPFAHEQFGRAIYAASLVSLPSRPIGQYALDTLVIDFDAMLISHAGVPRFASIYDWRVLRYLACRAGRFVDREELSIAIWYGGARPAGGPISDDDMHAHRAHLSRLRAKLRPAEPIETVVGSGIRLRADGATRLPGVVGVLPHCCTCSCVDPTYKGDT